MRQFALLANCVDILLPQLMVRKMKNLPGIGRADS
jgi:hypothetical protein